jgi:hypothetical protein
LSQTSKETVEAEAEVLHEASGPRTRPILLRLPPKSRKKNVEIPGKPKSIVDLVATKIYLYELMKFTFKDGKLAKAE